MGIPPNEISSADWSIAARCVAERCKIFDFRAQQELCLILESYGKENDYAPEYTINKAVLAFENWKSNASNLRHSFGSAIAFFRAPFWDNETAWPWNRATPRPAESAAILGVWDKSKDDGRTWGCKNDKHQFCDQVWCSCECHKQESRSAG